MRGIRPHLANLDVGDDALPCHFHIRHFADPLGSLVTALRDDSHHGRASLSGNRFELRRTDYRFQFHSHRIFLPPDCHVHGTREYWTRLV